MEERTYRIKTLGFEGNVTVEIPVTTEDFAHFTSRWGVCPISGYDMTSTINGLSRVCPRINGIARLLHNPTHIPAFCKCDEAYDKIMRDIEENALKLVCS